MTNFRILCLFLFVTATTVGCSDSTSVTTPPEEPETLSVYDADAVNAPFSDVRKQMNFDLTEKRATKLPLDKDSRVVRDEKLTLEYMNLTSADSRWFLAAFHHEGADQWHYFIISVEATTAETGTQAKTKVTSVVPWDGTKDGLYETAKSTSNTISLDGFVGKGDSRLWLGVYQVYSTNLISRGTGYEITEESGELQLLHRTDAPEMFLAD